MLFNIQQTMKKVIQYTGILLLSSLVGMIGTLLILSLTEGTPPGTLLGKFVWNDLFKIIGISFLSGGLMVIAVFFQIILHEVGHLLCGLASGYRFVSFRIFHFTLIRINGKFYIKRYDIAGTGGQCLLTPPDKPLPQISTAWYNLGGILANLLAATVALALLLLSDNPPLLLKITLLLLSVSGFILGLMNGIPLKPNGIGNDAYNMRLLLKNQKSKQALVTQLKINALIQKGVRPREMPQEWFQIEDIDYKDSLQLTIRLMGISRLQDELKWETACLALEEVMQHQHEILGLLVKEVSCELVFTALVTGRIERATALYTKQLETYIQQYKNTSTSKHRLLCAWALYQEKDSAKAREIYQTTCRQKEQYLMQGEVSMDLALMQSILTTTNIEN